MISNSDPVQPPKYLRVALQSALAAAFFLGFPAGLVLWLVLFRESTQIAVVDPLASLLQANGLNKIILLALSSLGWSFVLERISGYRAWWKIGLATALGIVVAVIIAFILKRTILKSPPPPFVMELPPYRLPNFRTVFQNMFTRAGLFIKRAGTTILVI